MKKNLMKKTEKEKRPEMLKRCISISASAFTMAGLFCTYAAAAGEGADPVGAVSALKGLFLSILSGIGVIIAAKNGFEMFQAYQQQDSAGMSSALKGVIGGVGMAGIGAILTLIGL